MYRFLKRFFDFFISLIAIIIFSPFFLVLPLLIAIFLGRPVLFKQKRIGRYNKIFNLYKFRSMNDKKDEEGNLLPDEQRLTTFGKILRKSSLDELPQLFSILIGNMSIVGPRPKTIEEVCLIKDTIYIYRHCVRPGITGLAIIKGRNELNPDKAFRIDLEYVANIGFWMDLKIFIQTFLVVLFKKGITSKNHATFVPHYIFWEELGVLSHEQIITRRQDAKAITCSRIKFLTDVSKAEFEDKRKVIVLKYKLGRKFHGTK